MTQERAVSLANLGLHVFPCRDRTTVINGVKYAVKSPYTKNGFEDATTDLDQINRWWTEHPAALVGVWSGPSGLVVLDIDVKRDDEGNITVDGFDQLDQAWVVIPDTFGYKTVGGEGKHLIYAAPEDAGNLGPKTGYRGMPGVDRRSGGSYAVWMGDAPESRDVFKPAPEWLLDATEVRSAAAFEGDVKDWFESLTPGEPNVLVRRALERIKPDMSHQEMVSAQYEAVRLGAEGNPGVPQLLEALEQAWLDRPSENHSTPETQWEYKFAEALASGIKEHGAAIDLIRHLPAYSLSLIPAEVSDRLVSGQTGDRSTFNQLLNKMAEHEPDDLKVLSVLWNAPTVRDLSRDWGLSFTFKRVQDARVAPAPVKENPSLEKKVLASPTDLLTDDEREFVTHHPTFIDEYLESDQLYKGWVNEDYATPAAWTVLSMAFGARAFIPANGRVPVNLWFINLGYSGSGKTQEVKFLQPVLDLLLAGGETYYNLGANSSAEAIHEALIGRDKKPSMILEDEAASFFKGLKMKEWMGALEHKLSAWYDGVVAPENKVRLKELKGKRATTSFNLCMFSTPDKTLKFMDTEMFDTGFLARANWSWSDRQGRDEDQYEVARVEYDDQGVSPLAYELVSDLLFAVWGLPPNPVSMDWSLAAEKRLIQAHRDMREFAKAQDSFAVTEQSIKRLNETTWKCAALLALYRGDRTIQEADVLCALRDIEKWFKTLFRVVDAVGDGDFSRDANEIEGYIASFKSGVSQAKVFHRFKGMIRQSQREIYDRLEFLVTSGRIVRESVGDGFIYKVNGGGE